MKNKVDHEKEEAEIKAMFYTTQCVEGRKYDPDCKGRTREPQNTPIPENQKK